MVIKNEHILFPKIQSVDMGGYFTKYEDAVIINCHITPGAKVWGW